MSTEKAGHVVRAKQGDSVESLAAAGGLFWETVWNHPKNAALREQRSNPHVLAPGDEVFIPERSRKEVAAATGQRHRFRSKGIPSKLRLLLMDNGKPLASREYVLVIDGQLSNGSTGADGSVQLAIPPNARQGKLIVGSGATAREYELSLGGLDPVSEPEGVRQRLRNLGFAVGDSAERDAEQAALRSFQERHGLAVSGKADAATQSKLQELHGT